MIELLREADMVLNACGRPTPPPGYRWVDLFYIIPFFQNTSITGTPATPYQARVSNNADTVFVCKGISYGGALNAPSIRVRWPDGTYLSQMPSVASGIYPTGNGPNLLAMNQERHISPGDRISVELSANSGVVQLAFWGVLRYLLKAETSAQAQNQAAASCIVGYATNPNKFASDAPKLLMMPDPALEIASRPRLHCGPNQNIMAPEWMLGNQCVAETPIGYEDESFTFFALPITVPSGGTNYGNAVIIPGQDDVVIKSVQAFVTFTDGLISIPTVQFRLPNGYSLTGGDMVPASLWPGGSPTFPTLRVAHGGRIIIDMADMQPNQDTGASTTIWQFDGVKRRVKKTAPQAKAKGAA
jgi:hypothetical protein